MKIIPKLQPADGRAAQRYNRLLDLSMIASRMTEKGWPVDRAAVSQLQGVAHDRQHRFTEQLLKESGLSYEHLGKRATGHTHSVRDFFWKDLKAPHVAFDKVSKKPQFNTAALIAYAEDYKGQPFSPLAALLLGIRKNAKYSSYLEAYEMLSRKDGRIHVNFNVSQAKTGRWSASSREMVNGKHYSCNIQQVPSKAMEYDFGNGKETVVSSLRAAFAAEDGGVIISADYNALEARLIAINHGVTKLIAAIEAGEDIHKMTGRGLFGAAFEKEPKLCRDAAKTCLYAFSYQYSDGGDDAMYKQAYDTLKKSFPKMTERGVAALAQKFFAIYPEILANHQTIREAVEARGGFALPLSGRFLHYPPTNRGYNQALNFMQQGAGAVLVDTAMLQLAPQLDWQRNYPLAQVHDQLLVHCAEDESQDIAKLVKQSLETPAIINGQTVSFPATTGIGKTWELAENK
jgi:DNA polymerase-1